MSRVEIYREDIAQTILASMSGGSDRIRKWRWRFVSNGHVMADSGQGYSRRIDCLNGCARVLGGMEFGPAIYRREFHMRADEGDDPKPKPTMQTDSLWIPVVDLTRESS